MTSQPIVHVDSFTDKPFAGNPAAVCLLSRPRDEQWMGAVAREMNLSETAFLTAEADGSFQLRWFTPAVEVDLCGHATLASAHVLWETGKLKPDEPARFHTRSGLLTCRRRDRWIEMDFPATRVQKSESLAGLVAALGLLERPPLFIGRSRFDAFVEVEDESALRTLTPNCHDLRSVEARGVIVTSRAAEGSEFDFVSRFFAPRAGVDEDPVTGSAHCALAPYWSERLGKSELVAFQASSRGGVVRVELRDDRVLISGQAVTVLRGELLIPET